MSFTRTAALSATVAALAIPAIIAGSAPALAGAELGGIEYGEALVAGNSPICFGRMQAEVKPNRYSSGGNATVRLDFFPAVPLVDFAGCVVPVTVFWQNLDTGGGGAVTGDAIPHRTLESLSGHGYANATHIELPTGAGRVVVRVSSNPNPGQIEVVVR